jgi:hypothetical protein
MRNEDVVRRNGVHVNGFRQFVAGYKRVKQQSLVGDLRREARMAVIGNFHRSFPG